MATERYSHNEVPAVAGAVPSTQPYALDWGRAIAGGLMGTVIITLMMYFMPPMIGMKPMDIGTMLGTMFLPHGGSTAFWLGLMMHFMMGIAFVLMYAAALLALRRQSTWGSGAVFGMVLWLIGPMLMMPVMMAMHPLVQAGTMMNPGFFMLGMGKGLMPALASLMMHLFYAVAAALIYKHRLRPICAQSQEQ